MERTFNLYAISRGRDLRELARFANFDAPFRIITRSFQSVPFCYHIKSPTSLCTAKNVPGFVRIGDGFFFANPAGQIEFGNARVMEEGLIYATPHRFDVKSHLADLTVTEFSDVFDMPKHWQETPVENPAFYGDRADICGHINGHGWNLWKA